MITKKHQGLKGQNNQCAGCGLLFKSNSAFDKHRVGAFSDGKHTVANRRCATEQEMLDSGMAKNAKSQWVTALYEGIRFYDVENDLEGDETGELVGECQEGEITA